MSHQCLMEVIHHLALLQPQGLHHSQYPLRKAATRLTVIAKGVLPPQHTGTQQPLDVVVRRLDTLHCREQPQGGVQRQHVSAKRRHLRIGACATALQRLLEFLNHRFQTRLQCGTRPRTLAEVPPQPEHVLDRLQPRLTDCYRRATATPIAWNTGPHVPWASLRSRNRFPSCSTSATCKRSRSQITSAHSNT